MGTDDKPDVIAAPPRDPNLLSNFLNLRVADIRRCYEVWSSRGAKFITEPKVHATEVRCYMRDPDGYLMEAGQTTMTLIGEHRDENERKDLVLALVQKRSELLRSKGQGTLADRESKDEGRMLVYSPSENVEDGASEVASGGFFDVYDAPPWDVWVAYSDCSLLAWVPPQLIGLAQSGIDVNPVGCIRWLD